MKVSTPTRISLALAFALATLAPAHAETVSGYGFDVTYDVSQLGTSWSASLGTGPTGATLLFQNSSTATADYFGKSFSFSITPRSVTSVQTFIDSNPEYVYNYELDVTFAGEGDQRVTPAVITTGAGKSVGQERLG